MTTTLFAAFSLGGACAWVFDNAQQGFKGAFDGGVEAGNPASEASRNALLMTILLMPLAASVWPLMIAWGWAHPSIPSK